jgi:hypothetical protein
VNPVGVEFFGICRICSRRVRLTVQGKLWLHARPPAPRGHGESCPGGYRLPAARSSVA